MKLFRLALIGTIASSGLIGICALLLLNNSEPTQGSEFPQGRFWVHGSLAAALLSPLWSAALVESWERFREERWGWMMIAAPVVALSFVGGCVGGALVGAGY